MVWMAHHHYTRFMSQPLLPVSCQYDYFLAHRLERRAVRKCDFAVFPSHYMERVFRETLHDTMPGAVIPNYFEISQTNRPSRKAIRSKLGIPESSFAVLIPSSGTAVKGSRFVPEIIRRIADGYPNHVVVITGPINSTMEIELDLLRRSRSILTPGSIPHELNMEYTIACDLAVSPALLENYSCALLECLSAGLPVVTFDVGGNSEIVADGQCGYVAPFLDIDAICHRTVELLKDTELLANFAAVAKQRAHELCNGDSILAKFDEVFATLTSQGWKP